MKRSLPYCLPLLLCLCAAGPAVAAFYQWTDANGVVHLTDKAANIPQKYRKKAKKVRLPKEPSGVKAPARPAPQPVAPPAAPAASQPAPPAPAPAPAGPTYGGHAEQWWRDQQKSLTQQVETVQKRIADKQEKLVELRRKRIIYHRPQDRVALNTMQAEIDADQAKLVELQRQLESLQNDAARAAVPPEWLR